MHVQLLANSIIPIIVFVPIIVLWVQIITQIVVVCYGFWFIIILVYNYYADVAYMMGNFKTYMVFLYFLLWWCPSTIENYEIIKM